MVEVTIPIIPRPITWLYERLGPENIDKISWALLVFFSIANIAFYFTLPVCTPGLCMYRPAGGEPLWGDCQELRKIVNPDLADFNKIIIEQPPAQFNIIEGECECPPPPEQTCPVCASCPVCPPQQTCPVCVDNTAALKRINNLRPTVENPAYQKGYFDMRRHCQEALGGETSKFDEAPGHFNNILQVFAYGNSSSSERVPGAYSFLYDRNYCFNITKTDTQGKKAWNWEVTGNTIKICHL
jgi:hypothetical protein